MQFCIKVPAEVRETERTTLNLSKCGFVGCRFNASTSLPQGTKLPSDNTQSNRRNKWSRARERNLPLQTNKKESGKLGLQISILQPCRQCLKCCRAAANNLRANQFRCSFIEMTRFWHFYWNLLKWFQQTALKVQFGPFYFSGVTFWSQHAQNHLPEILRFFS